MRRMHGVWQQCWFAMPASMVGNRFVVLAILPGPHTSFHWATLAKAYKQLWKDFVVTVSCAVSAADAFGSRSLLTTTQAMSTLLSKHLQGHVRVNFRDRNYVIPSSSTEVSKGAAFLSKIQGIVRGGRSQRRSRFNASSGLQLARRPPCRRSFPILHLSSQP